MPSSDAKLIQQAREGDREAFEELVRRFQRLVFNIIYHYLGSSNDVEDLAQEVFVKVYQSLDRYDTSRPFKNWIGKITANRCLDQLRRNKSNPVRTLSDLSASDEQEISQLYTSYKAGLQLTEAQSESCFRLLHSAMSNLSEKDRMAFVLRELEGLSYSEIAEMTGATELAVRIRLSRTRQHLEKELRRIFDEQP